MDPFDSETWKHQWGVFMTAPYVLLPLMVLALLIGWWIGNKLASARVEGLNGTVDNLKANIAVLEARLELAADREKDVQRARAELEKQVQELKAQVGAGAPNEKIRAITARVDAAIGEFTTANTALSTAITGVEAKAEVGKFGITISSDHPNSSTGTSN